MPSEQRDRLPSESGARCKNGGCTKAYYRAGMCYRCWSGVKWDSMRARVENRHGRKDYALWTGLPLKFTRREFIAWAASNRPSPDLAMPSIDRIDSALGYVPGNIRWLEMRQNSLNRQHDIPLSHRRCPLCHAVLPLTAENFHRNKSDQLGFNSYCRRCRSAH